MSILKRVQESVPDCTYRVNIGLGGLLKAIDQYKIDLDPDYQRGHVWTEEQERKFVGALLENHNAIPPFWFNWLDIDFFRSHSEVVDGKQRIKACVRWLKEEIEAECPCGISVPYDKLNEVDHRNLAMYAMMDWNFVHLNREDVMKFYLRLNCGGTVHTPAELEHVRKLLGENNV